MNLSQLIKKEREDLLNALGVSGLSEAEAEEVSVEITEHLERIVMETILANLNDEQLARFEAAIEKGGPELDATIMSITASVPGLAEEIERSVGVELEAIKQAKNLM